MDTFSLIQLVKSIVLGCALLVTIVAIVIPYWFIFQVQISWDAGRTMQTKSMDVGLFLMDQSQTNLLDLVLVEKASNAHTFPPVFRVAQILFGLGGASICVCFIASVLYFCRKYKSSTGEICLAGCLIPTSFCLSLGVILAALSVTSNGNHTWESLPVPNNFMQVEGHPNISIQYGLYIGAVAAGIAIVGTVLAWLQACQLCTHVENVRYQMLHAPLTEDEKGISSGRAFKFGNAGGKKRHDLEVDF